LLQVAAVKEPLIRKAAARLLSDNPKFKGLREEMATWRAAHSWIEDSALFEVARTLPELADKAWWDWPEPLRFRQPDALQKFKWVFVQRMPLTGRCPCCSQLALCRTSSPTNGCLG
jgi:hypothetical protein